MRYWGLSTTGMRQHNEDNYYTPDGSDCELVIVADGMGGHLSGEIASNLAKEEVIAQIKRCNIIIKPEKALREAILAANTVVLEYGKLNNASRGLGTTIVAALLYSDRFSIGYVGDSRIYLYTAVDGKLSRLTQDHSYVAELVRQGMITEKEALHHPYRNVITRAVGTSDYVEVDTASFDWNKGDALLFCSDGLSGSLDDLTIEEIMNEYLNTDELCQTLIDSALEAGSTDNITVAVAVNAENDL